MLFGSVIWIALISSILKYIYDLHLIKTENIHSNPAIKAGMVK